jgi:glycosyltransferase involved in cell wall biosynthesis
VEPCPPPNFSRPEWRARYGADYDTLLLAYFGFLNHSKGGEELIEALALLRQQGIDAQLVLIGGDVGHVDATNQAYAQKVEALIAQRGLAEVVHRTGYVELTEVSANLLAADAVVMPYRDGVSFRRTTLIAALRHGCPVISTTPANPALVPEVEPGENMLLAAPRNARSLAETIAALADNLSLRETLSYGALRLGNQFEWTEIASQTAALYQIVCE